jgi:hypothetical protein
LYVQRSLEDPIVPPEVTIPESLFPTPPGYLDVMLLSLTQFDAGLLLRENRILAE